MNNPGYQYILSAQNIDGGWGYFPNQPSIVEATSSIVIMLKDHKDFQGSREHALKWLVDSQNNDGGWGIKSNDQESGWQTAWALIALKSSSEYSRPIRDAESWLMDFGLDTLEENETDITIRRQFNIDTNLYGWPWQSGQASWIEPTAMTLLALRSSDNIPQDHERILEAVRYLDDRRCRGGGWNFGNPVMFNKDLPPRTHHTALCLLGLSQVAPERILDEDITTLNELLDDELRSLGIAMGILALKSLDQDSSILENKLISMQDPDGSWDRNTYFSAMALIALDPQFQVF